mmetsp:Transcript_37164/g.104886  ORF Transcript_37164/g.104886 Transcript_37164/m.104886 type:complete len:276 (-) Transcript_37164:2884-3711(-)
MLLHLPAVLCDLFLAKACLTHPAQLLLKIHRNLSDVGAWCLIAAVQEHMHNSQEALGRPRDKAAPNVSEQCLQDLHQRAVLAAQGFHDLAASLKGHHLGWLVRHLCLCSRSSLSRRSMVCLLGLDGGLVPAGEGCRLGRLGGLRLLHGSLHSTGGGAVLGKLLHRRLPQGEEESAEAVVQRLRVGDGELGKQPLDLHHFGALEAHQQLGNPDEECPHREVSLAVQRLGHLSACVLKGQQVKHSGEHVESHGRAESDGLQVAGSCRLEVAFVHACC